MQWPYRTKNFENEILKKITDRGIPRQLNAAFQKGFSQERLNQGLYPTESFMRKVFNKVLPSFDEFLNQDD